MRDARASETLRRWRLVTISLVLLVAGTHAQCGARRQNIVLDPLLTPTFTINSMTAGIVGNDSCTWQVTQPPGHVVKVHIIFHFSWIDQYIAIYDGASMSSPLALGISLSSTSSMNWTSTGPNVTLDFFSGVSMFTAGAPTDSITVTLFSLPISAAPVFCPVTSFTARAAPAEAYLSTDLVEPYPVNRTCVMNFTANDPTDATLTHIRFVLDYYAFQQGDELRFFYAGTDDTAAPYRIVVGMSGTPTVVIVPSRDVRVEFRSTTRQKFVVGNDATGGYFAAPPVMEYTAVRPVCGHNVINIVNTTGVFSEIGNFDSASFMPANQYPDEYVDGRHCYFLFDAGAGFSASLTTPLSLYPPETFDFTLYDGNATCAPSQHIFTSLLGVTYHASSRYMLLEHVVSGSFPDYLNFGVRGLNFTRSSFAFCGGTQTLSATSTPALLSNVMGVPPTNKWLGDSPPRTCRFVINAVPGSVVQLIDYLRDLAPLFYNPMDSINVYDVDATGNSIAAHVYSPYNNSERCTINPLCYTSGDLFSNGSSLIVEYTAAAGVNSPFYINYQSATRPSCPTDRVIGFSFASLIHLASPCITRVNFTCAATSVKVQGSLGMEGATIEAYDGPTTAAPHIGSISGVFLNHQLFFVNSDSFLIISAPNAVTGSQLLLNVLCNTDRVLVPACTGAHYYSTSQLLSFNTGAGFYLHPQSNCSHVFNLPPASPYGAWQVSVDLGGSVTANINVYDVAGHVVLSQDRLQVLPAPQSMVVVGPNTTVTFATTDFVANNITVNLTAIVAPPPSTTRCNGYSTVTVPSGSLNYAINSPMDALYLQGQWCVVAFVAQSFAEMLRIDFAHTDMDVDAILEIRTGNDSSIGPARTYKGSFFGPKDIFVGFMIQINFTVPHNVRYLGHGPQFVVQTIGKTNWCFGVSTLNMGGQDCIQNFQTSTINAGGFPFYGPAGHSCTFRIATVIEMGVVLNKIVSTQGARPPISTLNEGAMIEVWDGPAGLSPLLCRMQGTDMLQQVMDCPGALSTFTETVYTSGPSGDLIKLTFEKVGTASAPPCSDVTFDMSRAHFTGGPLGNHYPPGHRCTFTFLQPYQESPTTSVDIVGTLQRGEFLTFYTSEGQVLEQYGSWGHDTMIQDVTFGGSPRLYWGNFSVVFTSAPGRNHSKGALHFDLLGNSADYYIHSALYSLYSFTTSFLPVPIEMRRPGEIICGTINPDVNPSYLTECAYIETILVLATAPIALPKLRVLNTGVFESDSVSMPLLEYAPNKLGFQSPGLISLSFPNLVGGSLSIWANNLRHASFPKLVFSGEFDLLTVATLESLILGPEFYTCYFWLENTPLLTNITSNITAERMIFATYSPVYSPSSVYGLNQMTLRGTQNMAMVCESVFPQDCEFSLENTGTAIVSALDTNFITFETVCPGPATYTIDRMPHVDTIGGMTLCSDDNFVNFDFPHLRFLINALPYSFENLASFITPELQAINVPLTIYNSPLTTINWPHASEINSLNLVNNPSLATLIFCPHQPLQLLYIRNCPLLSCQMLAGMYGNKSWVYDVQDCDPAPAWNPSMNPCTPPPASPPAIPSPPPPPSPPVGLPCSYFTTVATVTPPVVNCSLNASGINCTAAGCPVVPVPANGHIAYAIGDLEPGDVLTFSCDSGYVVRGFTTLTCQADLSYDHPAPDCVVDEARPPPRISSISPILIALNTPSSIVVAGSYWVLPLRELDGNGAPLLFNTSTSVYSSLIAEIPPQSQPGYFALRLVDGLGDIAADDSIFFTDDCREVGKYGIGSDCHDCPNNAYCPGGNRIWPNAGWWNERETCSQVSPCPEPSSRCLGGRGSPCQHGYTGALCAACEDGYYKVGAECVSCPEQSRTMILYAVAAAFYALMAGAFCFLGDDKVDAMVSIIRVLQLIRTGTTQTGARLSPDVKEGLSYLSLVTFDFSFMIPACSFFNLGGNHFATLFWGNAVIAGLLIVPTMIILAVMYAVRKRQRSFYANRSFRALTIQLTLLYYVIATRTVESVACRQVGDHYVLMADTTIDCAASAPLIIGAAGLATFTIALPVGFHLMVHRLLKQGRTDDKTVAARYGYLYSRLRMDGKRHHYIPLPYVQLLVTAIAWSAVATGDAPYIITMFTFLVVLLATIAIRPYASTVDNVIALVSYGIGLASSLLSYLSLSQLHTPIYVAYLMCGIVAGLTVIIAIGVIIVDVKRPAVKVHPKELPMTDLIEAALRTPEASPRDGASSKPGSFLTAITEERSAGRAMSLADGLDESKERGLAAVESGDMGSSSVPITVTAPNEKPAEKIE